MKSAALLTLLLVLGVLWGTGILALHWILKTQNINLLTLAQRYTYQLRQHWEESRRRARERPAEKPIVESLKNLTASLTNPRTGQLSQVLFSLEVTCPTKACDQWLSVNRARFLNSLYERFAQLSLEDFHSSTGFEALKRSVRESVGLPEPNQPTRIYIKDLVMQ